MATSVAILGPRSGCGIQMWCQTIGFIFHFIDLRREVYLVYFLLFKLTYKYVVWSHVPCFCRCGYEFCYTCGAEWKNKKATCSCPLWDEDNIWDEDDRGDFDEEDEDDEYYSDEDEDW